MAVSSKLVRQIVRQGTYTAVDALEEALGIVLKSHDWASASSCSVDVAQLAVALGLGKVSSQDMKELHRRFELAWTADHRGNSMTVWFKNPEPAAQPSGTQHISRPPSL